MISLNSFYIGFKICLNAFVILFDEGKNISHYHTQLFDKPFTIWIKIVNWLVHDKFIKY